MTLLSSILGRLWSLPPARCRIKVTSGVAIPMRDGVALIADVYAPEGEPQPTVLIRSPYGRGAIFGLAARLFAERGYRVVIQSCRGTWDSGGALDPFFQEKADGLDTVDWIDAQPWFNGQLATFGPSYLGNVQWAIAAELGERLSAMAVAVSLSDFREELRQGGGFALEGVLGWIHQMSSMGDPRQSILGAMLRRMLGRGKLSPSLFGHVPLSDLDRMATGKSLPYWQAWLEHEATDPFWRPLDHRAAIGSVSAPVTMIAGWSDIFLPPQLRDFAALRAAGRDARIMIGPWTHIGAIGSKWAMLDALDWFDHHLKGLPAAPRKRVRYVLEGEGGWHEADAWPVHGNEATAFYPAAGGRLGRAPAWVDGVDSFTYDPADPTPSVTGPGLVGRNGHGSMKHVAERGDVVSYTSEPFTEPCDIVGPVVVEMGVDADSPHHDVFVCLCEIGADGVPQHLTDGYLRPSAGADEGSVTRTFMIELWPIARRLKAGSRLSLLIAGGAHPRYARNNGAGEPIGSATAMRPVKLGIRRRDTVVKLPIAQLDASR